MIAPDANLLIYAHQSTSPFHKRSKLWLEESLSSSTSVGIPPISIYGFLRFMTNTKLHARPLSFTAASELVESWLSFPNARILYPGDQHWEILRDLGSKIHIRGPLVSDAVLAATAIEYGAIVHTNDRDFARFSGLRWHNPLQA